jgi:hypothetical protein
MLLYGLTRIRKNRYTCILHGKMVPQRGGVKTNAKVDSYIKTNKTRADQVSFTDWQEMKVLFLFNRKAGAFMSKTKHRANNRNPQSLNSTSAH